jgi:hypothetical protein
MPAAVMMRISLYSRPDLLMKTENILDICRKNIIYIVRKVIEQPAVKTICKIGSTDLFLYT